MSKLPAVRRSPSARRLRLKTGGFTLIEVLVAVLIVAVVAIVLINRRIEVVQDAARLRDERVAWTLAALKMGDLSRDPAAIMDSDSGDFSKDAPDQANFRWSYESHLEPIPLDEGPDETPRSLRRVKLKILDPEDVELQTLEALFPPTEGESQ